jgi:hypothetical protein
MPSAPAESRSAVTELRCCRTRVGWWTARRISRSMSYRASARSGSPAQAVAEPSARVFGEPGDGVDEGVPVGLACGVESESVDAYGVGGDRVGQLAQRHLRAVAAQGREGEDEVGVAASVEGASRAGEGRAGGVQAVLRALKPGGVGGGDEPVAEHLHQIGAQLPRPAAHGRQRRLVRIPGRDQRMPQYEPYGLLVVGEFERGDTLGDTAHAVLPCPWVVLPVVRYTGPRTSGRSFIR